MIYKDAKIHADEIVERLKPLCIACEIAGSIRRKKQSDIKDIEVCIIPSPHGLFQLDDIINNHWGKPTAGRWPAKYTKIRSFQNIDIFTGTRETWGMMFFIRTGSAEFVHHALADWKKLTKGGYSEACNLYLPGGVLVPTPTEQSVFEAMKKKFVAPEMRL